MDSKKRGGVKSAMMKSVFSHHHSPAITQTSSCQRTYKSSKKVVTSSGAKVEVFESEAEGVVTSETIGGETTTESEYSEAERYCELEADEPADDIAAFMSEEMKKLMNAPMRLALTSEEDEDVFEEKSTDSQFEVCAKDTLSKCLKDCEIELENEESTKEITKYD